ncbi:protein [Lentinula edodes]|uniref:Protein n=1 Tax=Lentinula edodes TaxID=5353 RepID=A0A1Q3ELT1_LENED|nr:protein [Lentinula edodes]
MCSSARGAPGRANSVRTVPDFEFGFNICILNTNVLRLKILNELLSELSLNDQELARSLTHLQRSIDPSSFASKLSNDSALEARLSEEIESRLSSILEFLGGDVDIPLLDQIHKEIEDIASLESELSSTWSSSIDVISRINELHITLQTELLDAISTIPPALNKKHKADNALSAAVIEASLVKLSFMRARSHQKFYGYVSKTQPDATMIKALSIAQDKLRDEADDLLEEERALDSQIEEYARLMRLVDGSSESDRAGFAQIVEDYIRVEKETEECRRDLRRLGWTGPD